MPKIFTFNYSYTERVHDSVEVEAENYEEASAEFDRIVEEEDVDIESYSEKEAPPYIDPNQMDLPLGEP